VIVTSTNPATLAAKKATTTIPIIMTVAVDPVGAGLVASLARPGANVTGLTFDVDAEQLAAKRLAILKELIPSVSRVAILWNPGYGPGMSRVKGTEDAAHKLGIVTMSARLSGPGDLERTFADIRRARADAVTVLSDPLAVALRPEITDSPRDTEYRRSTPCVSSSRMAVSFRTRRASLTSGVAPRAMSIGFSRGRSRASCRSSNRPRSSYGST
jgi:putative ABC transport system substrate-binding protein